MQNNPMLTGTRFRAYPTPAQKQILFQWIGYQRFICNARVSETAMTGLLPKKSFLLTDIVKRKSCGRDHDGFL